MSECKRMIQKMADDFKCKVWVCKKIGKRVSFIQGLKAGVERFESPKIIFEDEDFVIFAQVENVCPELIEIARGVIDCVRNSAKNNETSTEG
ncbi:hypothetical protein [Thermotoga profunda]|uniref:hypothetical protein n=1 Tax=Thermotoga profunda TaxID=1508420 RepID=UPI000596DB5D|nr:hypothetical protein [Thermotoga profunda]